MIQTVLIYLGVMFGCLIIFLAIVKGGGGMDD